MVFQLVEVNVNVGFQGGCEALLGKLNEEIEEGVGSGHGLTSRWAAMAASIAASSFSPRSKYQ